MEQILLKLNDKKVFIQIGTNNGNDNFNKIIRIYNPDLTILVEPNKILETEIINNYNNINNVKIKMCAINTSRDNVKLYIPKYREGYSTSHYSILPMNDWGDTTDDLTSINSNSILFNDLLEEYNIKHINYLQIDTEGFDYEIINSIDFTKVKIDILRFEIWGFNNSCFTKFNKESENHGENGFNKICTMLSVNYNLFRINDADGVDIIAIHKSI